MDAMSVELKKTKIPPILLYPAITWPFGTGVTLTGIVNKLLPIIYSLAGIILFGLLLFGGFLWLTSTGDPDKVRKATGTMVNAVIGIAIVMFAYVATRVVGGFFGVKLI